MLHAYFQLGSSQITMIFLFGKHDNDVDVIDRLWPQLTSNLYYYKVIKWNWKYGWGNWLVYSMWKDLPNYDLKLNRGRSNKVGTYSDPILKKGELGELLHYSSSSKDLMLSQMDLSTSRKSVFSSQCHTLETVLGCSYMPKMTFARPGDVMKNLIM